MLEVAAGAVWRALSCGLAEQGLLGHALMDGGDGMVKPMIAVVDDDLEVRLFLEALLIEAGYEVQSWPSGLGAFEHLVRSPPALLILDLHLGDDPEAGWEILTLLRAETQTARVPVILLSADHEFLRKREWILRRKKHAMPLAKPFDVRVLLAQIGQALSPRDTSNTITPWPV